MQLSPRLIVLPLDTSSIEGEQAAALLARAPFARTLCSLTLSMTSMTGQGLRALLGIPNGGWRCLRLAEVAESALETFSKAELPPTLEKLSLGENIGSPGAAQLAAAPCLAQLKSLWLGEQIDDACIDALRQAPFLPHLQWLQLRGTLQKRSIHRLNEALGVTAKQQNPWKHEEPHTYIWQTNRRPHGV